jgi:hypothetical protein
MPLSELSGQIQQTAGEGDSLFITCASYEDRSTAVVERLAESYAAERAIIFYSGEYADKGNTSANHGRITSGLRKISRGVVQEIEFDMSKPIPPMAIFEDMCREQHESSGITSVTVDITTLPRQELLILLRVLDNLPLRPSIRLFYAEPARYGSEDGGGWLTAGVKSVRTVPGFGGIQHPGKSNLLLMFLGHEDERAAITWKRHQPRKTIVFVPSPSYRAEMNGIVERTHRLLFTKISDTDVRTCLSARGIEETEQAILEIWEQYHNSHFIVVAPLSTKLQTLGIYRAARVKKDIQISYAVPSIYNFMNYSEGVGRIWEVSW